MSTARIGLRQLFCHNLFIGLSRVEQFSRIRLSGTGDKPPVFVMLIGGSYILDVWLNGQQERHQVVRFDRTNLPQPPCL